MKKITYTLLQAFLLLCWLMPQQTQAQVAGDEVSTFTQATGDVTVCSDEMLSFSIRIENHSEKTLEELVFYPQMPPGMEYVSGSETNMTLIAGEELKFSLANLPPSTGEPFILSFGAIANCSLIDYVKSGSQETKVLVQNSTKLTYSVTNNGSTIEKFFEEPNGSDSYNVLYPDVQVLVEVGDENITPPRFEAPVNRKIRITNTGAGSLSVEKLKFIISTDAEVMINAVHQTDAEWIEQQQLSNDGDSYNGIDLSLVGNGNSLLEQGETIYIKDEALVNAVNPAAQTDYMVEWGCEGSVCNANDQDAIASAFIKAATGKPALEVSFSVETPHQLCSGSSGLVKYTIINNGSGNDDPLLDAAFDTRFQFRLPQDNRAGDELDFSYRFYVKNGEEIIELDDVERTLFSTYYSVPVDYFDVRLGSNPALEAVGFSDLDGDGIYDELPLNHKVELYFEYQMYFNDNTIDLTERYFSAGFIQPKVHYTSYANELESFTFSPLSSLFSFRTHVASISGSPDLLLEETYKFDYNATFSTTHNNVASPEQILEHIIEVPDYYIFKSAEIRNTEIEPYSVNGNQLVFRTGSARSYGQLYVTFTKKENCEGVSQEPLGLIDWKLYHYASEDCSIPSFLVAHQKKTVYNHCVTCPQFFLTQFEAKRTTLGWEKPIGRHYYTYEEIFGTEQQGPTIPKLTAESEGIRLNAGIEGDIINLTATGGLAVGNENAFDEAFFELTYDTPVEGSLLEGELMDFKWEGSFLKVNGTQINFPSNYQPVKRREGNTIYLRFLLPGYNPEPDVNLELSLNLKLLDNPKVEYEYGSFIYSYGERLIDNFRGYLFGDQEEVDVCSSLGTSFYYVNVNDSQNNVSSELDCEGNVYANHGAVYSRGNPFPSEYRPYFYYNSFEAVAPDGYKFASGTPVILENKYGTHSLNLPEEVIKVSEDGRMIRLRDFSKFPVADVYAFFYTYMKVKLIPDGSQIPQDFGYVYFNTDFSINRLAHLPKEEHIEKGFNWRKTIIIRNNPELSLAVNSVVEGYEEEVSWPVSFCNREDDAKKVVPDNSWVAVELEDGDFSTLLTTPTDAAGNNMAFFRYGPTDELRPEGKHMMIKTGSLGRGYCKNFNINARYVNCKENELQSMKVYASWNCASYPDEAIATVKGMANDNIEILEDEISIRYKTANLQWEVKKSGPETDALCASTPFEIDLLSSKYANMSDLELQLALPEGVELDNMANQFYAYPSTASATAIPFDKPGVFVQEGNLLKIDIDKLIDGPLPGTREEGQNSLSFGFNFMTSCEFDPGIPLLFTINGLTNCGDPISFNDQRRIKLTDMPLDDLVMNIEATEYPDCDASNILSVSIENNGQEASTNNKLDIYLPKGVEFLTLINGNGISGSPQLSDFGDHKVISWNLPEGYLQAGQTKEISFSTKIGSLRPDFDELPFVALIAKKAEVTCTQTGQTCELEATVAKAVTTLDMDSIFPKLIVSSNNEGAVCVNTEIRLSAAVQNQCSDCTFLWTPTNETTPTIFASPIENTVYTVTVTRPDGCADQVSYLQEVKEDTDNIPLVEIQADKDCAIPMVTLSVPDYEAYTYQWFMEGTAIDGATDYVFEATQAGDYKVVLNGLSCGRASESLYVGLNETMPDAAFTVENEQVEVGKELQVRASGSASGNYYVWRWGDGKKNITLRAGGKHRYLRPGKYTVRLEVRNFTSCQVSSSTHEVIIIRPLCVTVVPTGGDGQFYLDKATGKILFKREDCPGEIAIECLAGPAAPGYINRAVAASATTFSDQWDYEEAHYEKHGKSFPAAFNDFEKGKLGSWRPKASYTYNADLFNNNQNFVSGTFRVEEFNFTYEDANSTKRWLKSTTVQQYSPHGEPLVERNILDVSSVAKYGYNDVLPYVTAKNAEYESILFESFENVYQQGSGKWVFEEGAPYNSTQINIVENDGHSGKKSIALQGNYPLYQITTMPMSNQLYQQGLLVKFWLKAGSLDQEKLQVKLYTETNLPLLSKGVDKIAQTGEWTLFQASFKDFKSMVPGRSFIPSISYDGVTSILIDDVRIQPADAQMTTYVYDPKTLRLLTIFDDQHFGLYYQYNDEGKLVRKQIETERGLQTVQETHYNSPAEDPKL